MVDAYKEQTENELIKGAWLIRWLLSGMVSKVPSMDEILGKTVSSEMDEAELASLLDKINSQGKWDA